MSLHNGFVQHNMGSLRTYTMSQINDSSAKTPSIDTLSSTENASILTATYEEDNCRTPTHTHTHLVQFQHLEKKLIVGKDLVKSKVDSFDFYCSRAE